MELDYRTRSRINNNVRYMTYNRLCWDVGRNRRRSEEFQALAQRRNELASEEALRFTSCCRQEESTPTAWAEGGVVSDSYHTRETADARR